MHAQKTIKHQFWLQRNCPNKNTIRHKVIISSTPILGPDRENKNDNYANAAFTYEGNEIRDFINRHNNVYIVTGDRHWQYVSHRADTNLWEFSTGPGSDLHASGWKEDNRLPDHRFLRVKGGYLFASVYAEEGRIRLKFQHRDVDGNYNNPNVVHEEILPVE